MGDAKRLFVCDARVTSAWRSSVAPQLTRHSAQFLVDQRYITRTRRAFDAALRALPITQHHRIWPLYVAVSRENIGSCVKCRVATQNILPASPTCSSTRATCQFVRSHEVPETAVRVYRRHLMLDPDAAEDFVEYLVTVDRLDDAAGMSLCTAVLLLRCCEGMERGGGGPRAFRWSYVDRQIPCMSTQAR